MIASSISFEFSAILTPDPFCLTPLHPKAFRVFPQSLVLRNFMLMCLDGRSFFHSLYFGPQTLPRTFGLYSGSSYHSVPGHRYIFALILFLPSIFLFFFFVELLVFGCLSPPLLLWFTCLFFSFPLLRHFFKASSVF